MKSASYFKAYARAELSCALLACAVVACSTTREGPSESDTTTNWLHACKRNTDCSGQSSCIAGSCTIACSPNVESACSSLAPEAECVEPKEARAHCDLPCRSDRACDSLGDAYACNEGTCRPKSRMAVEESESQPGLDAGAPITLPPRPTFDASFDATLPVTFPPPILDQGFDASPLLPFDAASDGGVPSDSGFYYPFATDADAGPACPIEYPPVVWQPSAWEPFVTDAGRDERFKIVQDTMVGRWRGLATPMWPKPYLVELEFKADGHYGGHCSEITYPCCRALNTGADEEHPLKQYRLLDALASGYVIGELDVVYKWGPDFSGPDIPYKLSYVERDRSGNGLRLQLRNPDENAIVRFDLRRVTTP